MKARIEGASKYRPDVKNQAKMEPDVVGYISEGGAPLTAGSDFVRKFHQSYTETVEWEIEEIKFFNNKALARLSEVTTLVSKESD